MKLTKIFGEEESKKSFVCHAEGELLEQTNETSNIYWELISNIENMLENNPEKFYQMHINALKKYIELF